MSGGTHLRGLEGTNPLAFFAALGVQVSFANESEQPELWWSDGIVSHAVVNKEFTIEQIVEKALTACRIWKDSATINPRESIQRGDELKLSPEGITEYLEHAVRDKWTGTLATSLVAEGSLDNQNSSKPSDFYFTAGQQKFLKTARQILANVTGEEIKEGLKGPWTYQNHKLLSLGWDVADDRVYAYRAGDPSSEKKSTCPGPEALAILGLSLYPVYASRNRTKTQGCSGSWKESTYSWPLWRKPASLWAVKSLLAHAYEHPDQKNRMKWYRAWGISKILRAPIRRTDQGGYGTFGPPEISWP